MVGIPLFRRPDMVLVPIRDLPPMPRGLTWCTAHENARVRTLAATAESILPPHQAPLNATTCVTSQPKPRHREHRCQHRPERTLCAQPPGTHGPAISRAESAICRLAGDRG
jgi:hypothetical protein